MNIAKDSVNQCINVSTGDILFFYTYSSEFVCSSSIVKDHPVYILNLLPSVGDDWVFRDA